MSSRQTQGLAKKGEDTVWVQGALGVSDQQKCGSQDKAREVGSLDNSEFQTEMFHHDLLISQVPPNDFK